MLPPIHEGVKVYSKSGFTVTLLYRGIRPAQTCYKQVCAGESQNETSKTAGPTRRPPSTLKAAGWKSRGL